MGLMRIIKKGAGIDLIDTPQEPSRKMDLRAAKVVTSNFKEEDKFLMAIEQELQRSIEKLQKASEAIRVRRGFNSK